MTKLINGLHHITALAGDPQKNLDFYTGILGLRLVKKTINFDAPDTYHFYYADTAGNPGTILTFFPFKGIQPGRNGKGQLTQTSFSISENSMGYWLDRLKRFGVKHQQPQGRFEEAFISLEDPDGLGIELIATAKDSRPGFSYGHIPIENSIKGFHSVSLCEEGYEKTANTLTDFLDHKLIASSGNRYRYGVEGNELQFVDIICMPDSQRGLSGSGTVHHMAFSTNDDASQLEIRKKIESAGYNISPVLDRDYFHSIYFREPGGVLFEVATVPPGFAVDESPEHLGEELKLPSWVEIHRDEIIKGLTPVILNLNGYE
jgi:glyoxalase family protein